jgi:subtilisin family serine protease
MTEHGLFVAGIIHNLAPAAELHLFEVLNPDGVGDLESIAKGLWEVFDQFAGEPLVVNCSLVLNMPHNGAQIPELDQEILKEIVQDWREDQDYDYLVASPAGEAWLERQSQSIKWICDLLYLHGSKVIAAAGNDGKEKQERPHARFPAAFDSVAGVGALPKGPVKSMSGTAVRYTTASYSNISDEPGKEGVTTFGGEEGEKNGVLGVYTGEFPADPNPTWWRRFLNWVIVLLGGRVAGPRNLTDMAWWAGTSFATPILTGKIAAILSNIQPASTESAIVTSHNKKIIMDDQTVQHEDAMVVIQT